MNALRHGLLSREIVLSVESESDLTELEKRLRSDLKPQGAMELLLVDRIVTNTWRLRRLLAVEQSTMEYQRSEANNYIMPSTTATAFTQRKNEWERTRAMLLNEDMDKLTRYESSLERSIYRALHELQRIQGARNGSSSPLPIAIDVHGESGNE